MELIWSHLSYLLNVLEGNEDNNGNHQEDNLAQQMGPDIERLVVAFEQSREHSQEPLVVNSVPREEVFVVSDELSALLDGAVATRSDLAFGWGALVG